MALNVTFLHSCCEVYDVLVKDETYGLPNWNNNSGATGFSKIVLPYTSLPVAALIFAVALMVAGQEDFVTPIIELACVVAKFNENTEVVSGVTVQFWLTVATLVTPL